MTTSSHTRTTRIAVAALALSAAIATLAACTGGNGAPSGLSSSSTTPTVPTSASHTRPSVPTGKPTTVAPPTGTKTTNAPHTALSTPAEVTDAYARVSLGDEALWSGSTPSRSEALTRIEPYLTGRAYQALRTGAPEDVWHSIAFSVPSLGHSTGISAVTVSGAHCTPAGARQTCTESASATVSRTGKAALHIDRTIHVTLVPAPVKGGAAWLVNEIHNTDNLS